MAGASLFEVGKNVEFWRVLLHLSILAFCLVLLEKAFHHLERKFPPSEKYQQMLRKVYRELLVLGLLSFGLKIVKEMQEVNNDSKTMIAFQVADLTIFFLALALILQSTTIFLLLRNQNDRADCAELITTKDLAKSVSLPEDHGQYDVTFSQKLFCCGRTAKSKYVEKELIKLRLLRRLFLRRFGLPQLFPFSKYLSRAQANQISSMIEVEPFMWLLLLAVAWTICGVLYVLEILDAEIPESRELVESFALTAWIVLLLHVVGMLLFRSDMNTLVRVADFNDCKRTLAVNLNAIADEEAYAWRNEDADASMEIMRCVEEHHEDIGHRRIQSQDTLMRKCTKVQFVVECIRTAKALTGLSSKVSKTDRDSLSGVLPGSPKIPVRFFSHKTLHVAVMFLLILNGFLITLFVQCVLYEMDKIYGDYGVITTFMVPLPLVLNTLVLQPRIFYDFVVISNILRVDARTLSNVVENFSEIVQLRSEFATSLLQHLTQLELGIEDLQVELKARDANESGYIEVNDLRSVLMNFGYCLTRFRFNSVVKLLFELKGTAVAYVQVVRLVAMAQNERLAENTFVVQRQSHPLLRRSVLVSDYVRHHSVFSSRSILASNKQLPMLAQSSTESEFTPDDFVSTPVGSLPPPAFAQVDIKLSGTPTQHARPSSSSQALHDLFNLKGLSKTHGPFS